MKIADVSINRPVFAIMMSLALVTLGIFSYRTLGVDLMPKTDQPQVNVNIQLPGASPEEIEISIAKKVEENVNTINGIDELRTNSNTSAMQANITFNLERAMCRLENLSDLSRVIIAVQVVPVVMSGGIGWVLDTNKASRRHAGVDGVPEIAFDIRKKSGCSAVAVVDAVMEKLD